MRRQLAQRIVYMRKLLLAGMIAELRDDTVLYDQLLAEFEALASALPPGLVLTNGLDRYVVQPAHRKVEREGILVQRDGHEHEHFYRRHPELGGTWLCVCGDSYMGGRS